MAEKKTKELVDGNLARQEKQYRVITIGATERPKNIKLRVAAYARVSTASDDQMNSFAAQNRYYTTLISSKENWEMVDIYADRGVTGTSAEKREDFQRLLTDCRRGLIDRVLVKSISRFARNTKECLEVLRELKRLGISVCFEKENIDTATMSGEMMTAMFASFAQSESESISSNMRWSYQKRMQSGEFITCKAPFGYRLKNGTLEIEESEAEIVRSIFEWYLSGHSLEWIGNKVTGLGVPTRDGKTRWNHVTIANMIRNEKYIGDALLQKKYTTDCLPYPQKRNRGEKPQYYVVETHSAIIERKVYKDANELLSSRSSEIRVQRNPDVPFRGILQCGCCGTLFKQKIHKKDIFWICRKHDEDRLACSITQIPEERIQSAFLRLYYKLKHHGGEIFASMLTNLQTIRNQRMLWSLDIVELNKQISDLSSQNQMLAELKKQGLIDPDIFIAQTNELTEQLRAAKLEKERLLAADGDNTSAQTRELMELLETGPDFLETFDGELFGELVEKIIVDSNEQLRFRLKNGLELTESIERTMR